PYARGYNQSSTARKCRTNPQPSSTAAASARRLPCSGLVAARTGVQGIAKCSATRTSTAPPAGLPYAALTRNACRGAPRTLTEDQHQMRFTRTAGTVLLAATMVLGACGGDSNDPTTFDPAGMSADF